MVRPYAEPSHSCGVGVAQFGPGRKPVVSSDGVNDDVIGVGGEGDEVADVTGDENAAWLGCGHYQCVHS